MTPFAQLEKSAARGDQFLRAATKALTEGATGMDPMVRYTALKKLTETGYSGGVNNTLHRILAGKPAEKTQETGSILKLLTGHGTADTNKANLANTVRDAAATVGSGRFQDRTELKELLAHLPQLTRLATSSRRTTRLPNLPTAGIMSALKV